MATFVLVHGSFQGGWIWKPTAEVLRGQGHTVYAPTLDGCGERSSLIRPGITIAAQGQEVADFLFYEDLQDIVLVGTSTGGLVICKIAELARERINRVAFVDALAPQPGELVSNIVQRGPNAPPIPTTGLTRGPSREEMENRLFADLEPELRAWAVDRATPHPGGGVGRARRAGRVLGAGMAEHSRNTLHPQPEPAGSAPAPHRREAQRKLARDGRGALSDAEPPGGVGGAVDIAETDRITEDVDEGEVSDGDDQQGIQGRMAVQQRARRLRGRADADAAVAGVREAPSASTSSRCLNSPGSQSS